MVSLLESEAPKKEPLPDDEVFRVLNHRFLLVAGYSEAQIVGFGDLAKLTSSEVYDLLHKQTMKSLGPRGALGKRKVRRTSRGRSKRR